MEQRSGRRQVDLFNFSFLDILACVIGLLIFILTIVVVSGGGPKAAQRAQELAGADRQNREARFAATMAAQRRAEFERLLNRRAADALDPAAAATAVSGEIEMLSRETESLLSARLHTEAQLEVARQEIDRIVHATGINPAQVAALTRARQLDADTERLKADGERIRQQKVTTSTISYHIPQLRQTYRHQVWAEISGTRIWFLDSDSYERIPRGTDGTFYRRVPDAEGIRIRDDAAALSAGPLLGRDPSEIVLYLAVRPDGYAAFRALREQAWQRGYAVNWTPVEAAEDIVLSRTTELFEQ
ncbi:MAG TPA: hypothetical protein VGI81_20400 [Tepidisphaeraceae bacterium]|jgi:hypothetical protein